MKKLSKEWAKDREGILARLDGAAGKVNRAIGDFNAAVEAAGRRVADAVERYNELIGESEQQIEAAKEEIANYLESRSEKWLEGDRGQRYQAWIDELAQIQPPCLYVDVPCPIDVPDFEARDVLGEDFPDALPD